MNSYSKQISKAPNAFMFSSSFPGGAVYLNNKQYPFNAYAKSETRTTIEPFQDSGMISVTART